MPVQDSEIKQKKSEPTEDLDETKRKQIASHQEKNKCSEIRETSPLPERKSEFSR